VQSPAHNGETLPGCFDQGRSDSRRATPWEVLCLSKRYDPVTTDPSGVRLWILPLTANLHPGQDAGPRLKNRGEGIVCPAGNSGYGEVPTCTNGVTTWLLSQPEARRNCTTSKDARFPQ
jgi:hypothetical protein